MSREPGKIHLHRFGTGPDVVLVHGWGMHSGVWRDFATRFAGSFRVNLLDLPGHGRSGMVSDYTLEGIGLALLEVAPLRAHWLGWSLGAELALHIASRHPERVASLSMLAGNACFVRAEDWPCALEADRLARFAEDMIGDYRASLMKFLGLQTWGLENAREVLKQLRERASECAAPEQAALRAGLDILRSADLRAELTGLRPPLLLLLGARDRLTPPAAGLAMRELAGGGELHVLENAAHTPFLTHPDECVSLLSEFWLRHAASDRN
ncbi:MAG: pimeloyl-ACP methyl ester esterase BioH [Methylococcaceae bacterium]|nr:pimeloyl-ACP methyl ester esterase BioH [Methylococcaceae bacterium]